MEMQWNDERLIWDKGQWKLEKLQIHSANHIWIPVLSSQVSFFRFCSESLNQNLELLKISNLRVL